MPEAKVAVLSGPGTETKVAALDALDIRYRLSMGCSGYIAFVLRRRSSSVASTSCRRGSSRRTPGRTLPIRAEHRGARQGTEALLQR